MTNELTALTISHNNGINRIITPTRTTVCCLDDKVTWVIWDKSRHHSGSHVIESKGSVWQTTTWSKRFSLMSDNCTRQTNLLLFGYRQSSADFSFDYFDLCAKSTQNSDSSSISVQWMNEHWTQELPKSFSSRFWDPPLVKSHLKDDWINPESKKWESGTRDLIPKQQIRTDSFNGFFKYCALNLTEIKKL